MDDAPAWTSPTAPLSRIVLGVTGGIAAYKAAELVRLLVKDRVAVDVVLTDAGARFVTATTVTKPLERIARRRASIR